MDAELENFVEKYCRLIDEREEEYFKKHDEFFARMYNYAVQRYNDPGDFYADLGDACMKVEKRLGRPVGYSMLSELFSEYAFSLLPPEKQRGIYL